MDGAAFFVTGLFSDPCNFPLIAIINFLSVSDHILSAEEAAAKLRDVRRNTLPIQLSVKPTDGHEPKVKRRRKRLHVMLPASTKMKAEARCLPTCAS